MQMNQIRALRKKMNMTQKELAKQLQVTDSTLSYWEMGKYEPDNKTLLKLSKFFNVPVDYILGGNFTRWGINGYQMLHTGDDTLHLADSDMSVLDSKTIYDIMGASDPNTSKPATPSNATSTKQNIHTALDRVEFENLTLEEMDLLAEYALFLKYRRKHNR